MEYVENYRTNADYFVYDSTGSLHPLRRGLSAVWQARMEQEDDVYHRLDAEVGVPDVANFLRIRHFLGALGLQPTRHISVSSFSSPKVSEAVQRITGYDVRGSKSIYLPRWRLALVAGRNAATAEVRGMHEVGHSTDYQQIALPTNLYKSESAVLMRNGFRHSSHDQQPRQWKGFFWNEAKAVWLTAAYREQYGLWESSGSRKSGALPAIAKYEYPLFWHSSPGRPLNTPAGMAIDLLAGRDAGILDTLMQSAHSVTAIQVFRRRVNRLSPGMYDRLEELPYSSSGFTTGLAIVASELYEGNMQVAAHAGLEVSREYIANKIAKYTQLTGVTFEGENPTASYKLLRVVHAVRNEFYTRTI